MKGFPTTNRLAEAARRPAFVACGMALCLSSGAVPALAETVGVVELFTSQGCSSCPPGDETLTRLAADPDIVALTFSVDYWDYLGWKDTFAKPEFSERQRGYAAGRGDRAVYTPQVVVNGRTDVVGSDEKAVRAAIAEMKAGKGGLSVRIDARVEGDRIVVTVPAGEPPAKGHAALWVASYRQPETVTIGRGENDGRSITYTNVVERWQVLGMWDGKAMTVELPIADIAGDNSAGCAVILQSKLNGNPGAILGADKVDLVSH